MNIFDDLVNELKEDNLLEETVLVNEDLKGSPRSDREISFSKTEDNTGKTILDVDEFVSFDNSEEFQMDDDFLMEADESGEFQTVDEMIINENATSYGVINEETNVVTGLKNPLEDEPDTSKGSAGNLDIKLNENLVSMPVISKTNAEGAEYFRKRAVEEVNFLQMIEHVFSGVEREHLKIVPITYDDLRVKKVLHEFLQISEDDLDVQAKSEFTLLQETESWYLALTKRDRNISIGHLRRFCETTRPHLSTPALVALSRFYRNSPFTESVRNKFDLVVTRLFSKELDNDKRELVFTREELISHLQGLYAEWESIPLYSPRDDSEILSVVKKIEEYVADGEKSDSFDELVENDYFNRIRTIKKESNENFFSPVVTAAVIEANLKIGNLYVDLIQKEREKTSSNILEEKYGFLLDKIISDVACKTLEIEEILKVKKENKPKQEVQKFEPLEPVKQPKKEPEKEKSLKKILEQYPKVAKALQINKWVLYLAGFVFVATLGLYIFVEFSTTEVKSNTNVKVVNIEDSLLNEYILAPRVSGDTFYAVVLPNWDGLAVAEKEEILKKVLAIGVKKGFVKVHFFDKEGKTAGAGDNTHLVVN